MEKRAVIPKNIAQPVSQAYSHAIDARGNRFLFIAGQVALDPSGKVVGIRDIRAQTRQVFENIKAVLQAAGGGLENLVKTNTYMVNLDDYYAYTEVRSQYLTHPPLPAATLLEVKSLALKDLLIEIEGIAVLD
jgi:2-iminobutanoate/2-iminopropanoate deaminase